jgi:hypothetical protein
VGLATLNVWIHDQQDPCRISDLPWRVFVTYCNGNPVEWCGHTYSIEEAKCGHAEFQLPPGCYFVGGYHGIEWQFPGEPPVFISLLSAERAIVIVGCEQTACIFTQPPFGIGSMAPGGRCGLVRKPESSRRTKSNGWWLRRGSPQRRPADRRRRCSREVGRALDGIF